MHKLLTGIVDDHPLFVDAIEGILQHLEWSEVKFTGNDAASLMKYIETNPLDLLLLDISLPDANGIQLIQQLRKKLPALRILILTTHQPADINLYREDCQFDAYVLKISGRKVLEDAFIQIRLGQYFLDPNLVFPEIKDTINPIQLTKREKEIIALITAGKTTREIAAQLYLSEQTIKTHRRNISEKLDGKNMSDLIYKMNQLKEKK